MYSRLYTAVPTNLPEFRFRLADTTADRNYSSRGSGGETLDLDQRLACYVLILRKKEMREMTEIQIPPFRM